MKGKAQHTDSHCPDDQMKVRMCLANSYNLQIIRA